MSPCSALSRTAIVKPMWNLQRGAQFEGSWIVASSNGAVMRPKVVCQACSMLLFRMKRSHKLLSRAASFAVLLLARSFFNTISFLRWLRSNIMKFFVSTAVVCLAKSKQPPQRETRSQRSEAIHVQPDQWVSWPPSSTDDLVMCVWGGT